MANCLVCKEKTVFLNPGYCRGHFIEYFENKVKQTIERFGLVKEGEMIGVAVSGGKDSQGVLYLLHKFYGAAGARVSAIAINEGIPGYRDKTLEDLEEFCNKFGISYKIYSFEETFGKPLVNFLEQGASACRSCGVLRRHLINANAKEFDKLATGHNMDDECQSIIMNFLKGSLLMNAKLGVASGIAGREGFTQRIKPLYFCSEKETAAYAFLQNFPVKFNECPHSFDTFRTSVRDALNEIESRIPGTKKKIIENFLLILPKLKETFKGAAVPVNCSRCGNPATGEICQACKTLVAFSYAD